MSIHIYVYVYIYVYIWDVYIWDLLVDMAVEATLLTAILRSRWSGQF